MNAIFVSFDDSYFHFAKSCIASIKLNYPTHPEILVNYVGNRPSVVTYLTALDRVKMISLKERYAFDLGPVQSPLIFQRFNLWTDQFEAYNNVLHLDVDTVVLASLDYLFAQDEFYICSNHDSEALLFSASKYSDVKPLLDADGFGEVMDKDDMGNAGVFMIPKKYRTAEHYERLMILAHKYHEHVAFADQSIISLWCHLMHIPIRPDYRSNCQISFLYCDDLELDIEKTTIFHFTGDAKPGSDGWIRWRAGVELYEKTNQIRYVYRNETPDNNKALAIFEDVCKSYRWQKKEKKKQLAV